ncbi:hypothetical protein TREVI0001_0650 [Treponema vincentii ATCC 35580]|uniref:Uncharacterized protein n=1 Tax=Treponema vincentii ATCC 35580 TaxID=596324 RepID=C8PMN5_9SPIR|nr:hypothetical protein TREVI0001_0650 [Treponema vincentii ATCC 35580]
MKSASGIHAGNGRCIKTLRKLVAPFPSVFYTVLLASDVLTEDQ